MSCEFKHYLPLSFEFKPTTYVSDVNSNPQPSFEFGVQTYEIPMRCEFKFSNPQPTYKLYA